MIKCPYCRKLNLPRMDRCGWCLHELDAAAARQQSPLVPILGLAGVLLAALLLVWAWVSRGPKQLWLFKAERIVTSPLVVGDAVVFGTADKALVCVDLASGERRWESRPHGVVHIGDGLVHAHGLVLFRDGDRVLRAVSATDGGQVWKHASPRRLSRPAVNGDTVVVGDGWLLRLLDARTGQRRDEIAADSQMVLFDPVVWDRLVIAGYAVPEKRRIFTGIRQDIPGGLCAFDLGSGELRWSVAMPRSVLEAPLTADGVLYARERGTTGALHAFAPQSGRELWRAGGSHTPIEVGEGALWRGLLHPAEGAGAIEAVDTRTGTVTRTFAFSFEDREDSFDRRTAPELSSLCAAGGRVYFGLRDRLYCMGAASGRLRWTWPVSGSIDVRPAVAGAAVLVATDRGFLYAIRG